MALQSLFIRGWKQLSAYYWKLKIAQELKSCGYDVDMNRIV